MHAGYPKLLQVLDLDGLTLEIAIKVALAKIVGFPPKVKPLAFSLQVVQEQGPILGQH